MSELVSRTYSTRTYFKDVYVLKREWNATEAKEVYRLYKQLETFTDGLTYPSKSLHYVAQGDTEWAAKTAEHYKIKIEEEKV